MAKKRKSPSERGSTRRGPARQSRGCLFWAVLAVVVLSVAVAARKPLEEAFARMLGRNRGEAPTVVVKPSVPEASPAAQAESGITAQRGAQPSGGSVGAATPEGKPAAVAQPPAAAQEKPPARRATLFFARVSGDGRISVKGVVRPIPASDSPLRDALQTLMAGPTSREVNQGLLTMISSGARLRSVVVRGDTAVLDFSESFRFSTLGREGLNTQLEQIVFAATDFPTVKNVQILIEGKKVQYLGPEGIRIDAPLTRGSFPEQSTDPLR